MSNLNEPRKHVGASWNWLPPKFEQAPAPKTREQVGAASQRALAAKVSANQNRVDELTTRITELLEFVDQFISPANDRRVEKARAAINNGMWRVSANQNRAKQYRVSKFWKFNSSNPQVGDWTWSIKNIATGWVVATRKTRKQAEAYAALKNGGSK